MSLPFRMRVTSTTDSSATPTFTPDISNNRNIQIFDSSNGGSITATIANHATGTLAVGDILVLVIYKSGAGSLAFSWGSQYKPPTGSTALNATGITSGAMRTMYFRWDGTDFRMVLTTPTGGAGP